VSWRVFKNGQKWTKRDRIWTEMGRTIESNWTEIYRNGQKYGHGDINGKNMDTNGHKYRNMDRNGSTI
jgi:hypothetical protein